MLRIILRKMIKTRWMILCLLIGVVIAASMFSSIPQYTGGVLQKLLTKDLENYQVVNNVYSGSYHVAYYLGEGKSGKNYQSFANMNSLINSYFGAIDMPAIDRVTTISNNCFYLLSEGHLEYTTLEAMTDLDKHVKMIYGHYPSAHKNGDAYEVMISTSAMQNLGLDAGSTYLLQNLPIGNSPSLKVIIAGVYEAKSKSDIYWYQGNASHLDELFFNYSLFLSDFGNKSHYQITSFQWYSAFDYHKITLNNINSITSSLETQQTYLASQLGVDMKVPALDILKTYDVRQKQLQTLLWMLEVPVIIMLIFYLFMVAQLIIDEEKSEIAVIKSRGASRAQIFRTYFTESLIMGGFALIFGPLLGLLLSSILGASSGFLEFVQRTSLPVKLGYTSYLYALIAIGIFIVTMLVPAFFASGTTIVVYKQESRNKHKKPFWKKYFLDFLLLAVSCYGIYSYDLHKGLGSSASTNNLPIDPLLFLISTLFILGVGLIFVRIFPIIINFVFWVGRKFWKPSAYATLLYVSRSGGMNQFLILFVIFTISVGIFNATAARTINTNSEDKINYSIGADITLMPSWKVQDQSSGISVGHLESATNSAPTNSTPQYIEPDFSQFQNLSGVDIATKVYKTSSAFVHLQYKNTQKSLTDSGGTDTNSYGDTSVTFMGIIPGELGKVAWFKPELLPYHWFNYLNLLTKQPQALLLSRAFEKNFGVKLGDEITVGFGSNGSLSGIAYAFVDYWPSCDPNNVENGVKQPYFIVGNLNYFLAEMPLQPYQIWIKKKSGATSTKIYNDIKKKGIQITNLSDTSQEIIKSKNDMILEGINGSLTLSFLITMIITAAGFLIYWIMSIRSRILQFGILRAMGLTFSELIKMLVLEQALISVLSVVVGIAIGNITSYIFVPMLQMAFGTAVQVPPFVAVANVGDYLKILVIMAFILISGITTLSIMIHRIRMEQALKLGED